MFKNWGTTRIIILIIIIAGYFISRTILNKESSPSIPPLETGINRNVDKLVLTKHALCRMECRDITEEEVKEILHNGTINYMKSDLDDKRGATYALEGYSHDRQHLRIVFSPRQNEMIVVTCIDLDNEAKCECN